MSARSRLQMLVKVGGWEGFHHAEENVRKIGGFFKMEPILTR